MTKEDIVDPPTNKPGAVLEKLGPYIGSQKGSIVIVVISVLITTILSVSIGLGIRSVIDDITTNPENASSLLNEVLLVVLAVIAVYGLAQFMGGYYIRRLAAVVTEKIRCDVFSKVMSQDLEYIERQTSGDVQTRIVADTNTISEFIETQVTTIMAAALSLIGGVVGALMVSPKMTGMVLLSIPVVFLPFILISGYLQKLGASIQSTTSDLGSFAGEKIRHIKVIHAFNKEKAEKERFFGFAANITKQALRATKVQISIGATVSSLAFTSLTVLIWYSGKSIVEGNMTVGQLVAFTFFTVYIIQSIAKLIDVVASANVVVGAAEKIVGYLGLESQKWPSTVSQISLKKEIEYQNVQFSYPTRPDVSVLNGVNLTIKSGSQIAFVGPSGAGKSTIMELLLRFYKLQHGSIFIDGTDIREIDKENLRSLMGFVPQKVSLISGTVMENIRYGKNDASDEDVKAAAKMAFADEFILSLSDGYDTDLGEVGDRLSGGQKQRVSLARALLRDPQLLLLDEASSALDNESERLTVEAINTWAKENNKTTVTIAHRLTTARHADVIVVIDNGFIVGQGSHEELSNTCVAYQKLISTDAQNIAQGDQSNDPSLVDKTSDNVQKEKPEIV